MENSNILESGVWQLQKLKDKILTLEELKNNFYREDAEENRIEKEIVTIEKMIQDEIHMVVSKREEEISITYDEQISRSRMRMKKILKKKIKAKDVKIKDRINQETSTLQEDNRKRKLEVKAVLNENHITGVCNNRLYFALFAPKGVSDYLIAGIFLLSIFLMIPVILYQYFFASHPVLFTILYYLLAIGVVGGSYYLLLNATKRKNPAAISNAKAIRYKIRQNNRKINAIKREVRRDKDESSYGLEEYDKEIHNVEASIADVINKKKEALAVFQNTTSKVLEDTIKQKHQAELDKLREEYDRVYNRTKQHEDKIKELTVCLADQYEAFLGKNYMSIDAIDRLIKIMEEQDCYTIGQALEIEKNRVTQPVS